MRGRREQGERREDMGQYLQGKKVNRYGGDKNGSFIPLLQNQRNKTIIKMEIILKKIKNKIKQKMCGCYGGKMLCVTLFIP